jgi:hypothetical protein
MLSTLKTLNNTLERCVGTVKLQTVDGKLGAKSQTNSHSLVGVMNTPLRGKPTKYFKKVKGDDGIERLEVFESTLSNNEELTKGLLNYSIFAYHDPTDVCEISQETMEQPVIYVGSQKPQFYRVYNEPMYRQYNEYLERDYKPIIDPATRMEIADRRRPYDPANYRRAYPEGTTVIPQMHVVPPQPRQPVRQSVNQAPVVADNIDINLGNFRPIFRQVYPTYSDANINARFNSSIIARVRYGIQHFLMSNENNRLDANGPRTELLMGAINLRDLYTLFHFSGEEQPAEVNPASFRGLAGFESNGIIFARDRPNAHHFQNGRLVLDRLLYIEFFMYVLQAYFYTGLTQRRPSVVRNYITGVFTLFIPYFFHVEPFPFQTRTAIFEVELRDYMDESQRWILTMVNRSENHGPDEDNMFTISPPAFNDVGDPITFDAAAEIAGQRRAAAEALVESISPPARAGPVARISPMNSRSSSEAGSRSASDSSARRQRFGAQDPGSRGFRNDDGYFFPDPMVEGYGR